MKDKFLGKIVKENYNNQLEKILSKKDFSEEVKNALLSMFYKIETGYDDYSIIKRETFDKKEYIESLIYTINNDCDKIEFIGKDEAKQERVNKKQKEIICMPIDINILYSLAKIEKRPTIIKEFEKYISIAFSDFLNTGNNINMVEPLRDFNGFSWNIILKDIEDLNYNLMYQNVIYLVGNKFVDKWVNNYEALVDYFEIFQNTIEQKYGKDAKNNIIEYLLKLSIWINAQKDDNFRADIENRKENLEEEFFELENKEIYLAKLSKLKKKKEREIKKIDKTINDKKLLKEEYEKRNESLPLDKKIFSSRVLKNILQEERRGLLKEINKYNKMMNPRIFLEKKKEIEKNLQYMCIYDDIDLQEEINKNMIKLQKQIIECMKTDVDKTENKANLIDMLYKYRYYNLLPVDEEKRICDILDLKEDLNNLTVRLVDKVTDMKILIKITDNQEVNDTIIKQILLSKIISFEDINIKITNEKTGIYVTVYDEETKDNKIKLENITKEDVKIKFNKKVKLFI